jgi:hypothetical protein
MDTMTKRKSILIYNLAVGTSFQDTSFSSGVWPKMAVSEGQAGQTNRVAQGLKKPQ